jgi:hypothetical protein
MKIIDKKGDKMISKNNKNVRENKVEDAILTGVLTILDKNRIWTGTMTALNKELVKNLGKKTALPRSPSALRIVLNRVVNRLRNRGVSIKFGRTTDHMRTRYVKFITR